MPPDLTSHAILAQSPESLKAQTGLLTLLFTDMVDSTALKRQLGDQGGAALFRKHHQLVRELLARFPTGQEIETAGDSFLIVFSTPSDAVRFGLLLQSGLRRLRTETGANVADRIGIHVGEVVLQGQVAEAKPRELYGIQIDTCSRIMALARGGQVLMSRGVFDSARQVLKGEDIESVGSLDWLNHGPYLLKGLDEAVEICEVRESGPGPAAGPPTSTEKAQRQVRPDEEPVLGWRPAMGQNVPDSRWSLERKLGEGAFGEVWLGRHQHTKERRVFKFCFQADRVRFLKREMTLFRLLKERIGDHPNIVRLHDIMLERPPFYVEMDYVEGADLRTWCDAQGGLPAIPLETRLEIVAQAADALQAAHDAGVIHRDVKPANILIRGRGAGVTEVQVKLTDFGIGQVLSEEYLQGITRAGFTQTMAGSSSSSQTGTQLYMAPELLAGMPASTRSDIYSLGVVLYQVLVANFRQPVTTDWAGDISDALLREDLQQCFAGKPEERFTGAGQLAHRLRQLTARRSERERLQSQQVERERLQRQAVQRHKILIGAASVAALMLLLALTLGYGLRQAQIAKASETRLRRDAERRAYAADMKAAQVAIEQDSRGQAARLLAHYRPNPGEEDLRGVEWRYLWRRLRGDELETWARPSMVDWLWPALDGRHLLSGEVDRKIQVLDIATGQPVRELDIRFQFEMPLAVSPDGALIAYSRDDLLTVLRLADGQLVARRPFAECVEVGFLPEGPRITAASGSKVVVFRISPSGELEQELSLARPSWGGLAFTTDGHRVFIGGSDEHPAPLREFAVPGGAEVSSGAATVEVSGDLRVDPSSRYLIAVQGNRLSAYSRQTRQCLWTDTNIHRAYISEVVFSKDGEQFATASHDQTTALVRTRDGALLGRLRGHQNEVWTLTSSSDGQFLYTGSKDGTIKKWRWAPPPETGRALLGSEVLVGKACDGDRLVTFDTVSNRISRWSGLERTSWPLPSNLPPPGTYAGITGVAVHYDDSAKVVFLSTNSAAILYDLRTSAVQQQIDLGSGEIWAMAMSPNRRWMALARGGTNSSMATVEVWDLSANRLAHKLPPVDCTDSISIGSAVRLMVMSPDSRFLALPSAQNDVILWSLEAAKETKRFSGASWYLRHIAFSPDGKQVAAAGAAGVIYLWDMATGRLALPPLHGHGSGILTVYFTRDGRTLVTAGDDNSVRFWSTANGVEMLRLANCFSWDPLSEGDSLLFIRRPLVRDGGYLERIPTLAEIEAAEKRSPMLPHAELVTR